MSLYRLELWFNFDAGGSKGWGLANVTTSQSPSVVPKKKDGKKVMITDGSSSSMDVVVFDASTQPVVGSNTFDDITIDFEVPKHHGQPGQGNNPIADAAQFRNGMTSAQFDTNGPTAGMSIYTYPGGTKVSLNGWENTGSFESLNAGNYKFTVTIKATPAGGTQRTFSIDPEMEIDGGNP